MTSLPSRLAAALLGAASLVATPGVALARDGERRERTERSWDRDGRDGRDRQDGAATPAQPADPATPAQPAPSREERRADRMTEWLRSRCLRAIDMRLKAMERADARLEQAKALTDEHQAALAEIFDSSAVGLGVLREDIAAETDRDALRADCTSIFEDFRVFALVLPRAGLVTAADMTVALADRLDAVADKLAAAIDALEAADPDADTTQLEADLAAMRDRIDAGRATAEAVPDSIMSLTPTDWNEDHSVLRPARESLRSARGDLWEARRLAGAVREGLDQADTADQNDGDSDDDATAEKELKGELRREERSDRPKA